jgi:hypothetical protein
MDFTLQIDIELLKSFDLSLPHDEYSEGAQEQQSRANRRRSCGEGDRRNFFVPGRYLDNAGRK